MRSHGRHLIKDLSKVNLDLFFDTNSLLEQVNLAHGNILVAVNQSFLVWIFLSQTRNDCLMNLQSNFFFDLPANWLDYLIAECLVDVFFVVVYCNIRLFKMLNIPQH